MDPPIFRTWSCGELPSGRVEKTLARKKDAGFFKNLLAGGGAFRYIPVSNPIRLITFL